jgi:hypothetical protein
VHGTIAADVGGCCLMVDANAPAASRVRAASCILERAAQAIEIEEIEGRLDALESAAEDSQGNHG